MLFRSIKGQQRNQSEALMRGMLNATVMPEVRAHIAAIQNAAPESPKRAIVTPLFAAPTAEEQAAFEAAKAQAKADMDAAPAYTPSDLKRWKDSQERYAYLFKVKFEQGAELVPADAAWMEAYEQTPEYERYGKARYEGLKAVYARQTRTA